jgi:hypothetical protein
MKTLLAIVLFLWCLTFGGCTARPPSNADVVVTETPAASPTSASLPAAESDNSVSPQDENPDNNANPDVFTGTASVTDKKSKTVRAAMLVGVRSAQHPDFDRIVFEFRGDLPSYHVEYIDKPIRHCGSGNPVSLAGDAWLQIRFSPANAHTESGELSIPTQKLKPNHAIVIELVSTCDFEAEVEWVVGVTRPNKYRVTELKNPTRLAIDVRH